MVLVFFKPTCSVNKSHYSSAVVYLTGVRRGLSGVAPEVPVNVAVVVVTAVVAAKVLSVADAPGNEEIDR